MKRLGLFPNFQFSARLTISAIVLAAICFWCATWQWDKYGKKVALIDTYQTDSVEPPIVLDPEKVSNEELANHLNRRVRLSGTYDFDRQIIVTNRKHAVGPGHWLLTPLKLDGTDRYVIVSRGFIPFRDRHPEDWKKYSFSAHELLDAVVKPSSQKMFMGPSNPDPTAETPFPQLWFFPEISKYAKLLPYPVMDAVFLQRIGKPPAGKFPAQSILVTVPPQTHFGYTIEWTLLGLGSLLLSFVLQAFPRKRAAIVSNLPAAQF